MRKIIAGLLVLLLLTSCGSKETYDQQVKNYHKLVKQARDFESRKEFDKALMASNNAVDITDTLAPAFHVRGDVFLALNRWEDAIEDYSEAIEIDGEKSVAYKGRAISSYNIGEKGDFIDDINTYISHHNNDIYAHTIRGDYFSENEDFEEAIKDYSVCIKHDMSNPSFYLKRGNAYAHIGQDANSIDDYDRYTKFNPGQNNDAVLYKKGLLNMKVGEYRKAIDDLAKINDASNKPDVLLAVADCFFKLSEVENAVEIYSIYLQLVPNDYVVYSKRGAAYLAANNISAADSDFIKAANLKWDQKGIFYKYGWYLLFVIGYVLLGIIISKCQKEEHDGKKTTKSYWYYFLSGIFGGHHIYTKSFFKYLLLVGCILAFGYINSFTIRSFFNQPEVLWQGISENPTGLWLLYAIIVLLTLDFIFLPYYVFSENHNARLAVSDTSAKQRRLDIDELIKLGKEQHAALKRLKL